MKQEKDDSKDVHYKLPGGGQNGGESFTDTLKRECMEELGVEIDVGEIRIIREYIGKNHEFAHIHSNFHQVEYIFCCSLKTDIDMSKSIRDNPWQIGYEWIKLSELKNKNIYPKVLSSIFDDEGNITAPIYLGDIN